MILSVGIVQAVGMMKGVLVALVLAVCFAQLVVADVDGMGCCGL